MPDHLGGPLVVIETESGPKVVAAVEFVGAIHAASRRCDSSPRVQVELGARGHRQFVQPEPDVPRVTDITSIPTGESWWAGP